MSFEGSAWLTWLYRHTFQQHTLRGSIGGCETCAWPVLSDCTGSHLSSIAVFVSVSLTAVDSNAALSTQISISTLIKGVTSPGSGQHSSRAEGSMISYLENTSCHDPGAAAFVAFHRGHSNMRSDKRAGTGGVNWKTWTCEAQHIRDAT